MAAGYDGSIKIITKIATEGFEKGKKRLEQGLEKLSGSMNRLQTSTFGVSKAAGKAFESARLKAQDTEIAIEEIEKRMQAVREESARTGAEGSKAFQKTKAKAEELNATLKELYSQRDLMAQQKLADATPAGMTMKDLPDDFVDKTLSKDIDIKAIDKQISSTEARLESYKIKMKEAKAAGSGLTDEAEKELKSLQKKLDGLNVKLLQYRKRMEEAQGSTSKFSGIVDRAKKAFKGVTSESGKTVKHMSNFERMFRRIVSRMVIFAAIAITLRSVSEGMRNLAQANDSANATISKLTTNFLYLKNSIAAALMPALQALAPVIIFITDALARLFSVMGMLTARIFGGSTTFVKAKKAQTDYAKSLGKTGKAAKDTARALAAFDELNVLQKKDDGSGGDSSGVPAPGAMFEEVAIPEGTLALADKITGLFERLKVAAQPTVDAFNRLGNSLEPFKNFAWNALKDFYEGFLKPVGMWTLGEGIPRLVDAFREGLERVDWERINGALNRLWEVLAPFAVNVGEGLLWFWENILVPLGTWTMNNIVPLFLEILAGAISILNAIIEVFKPFGSWLWNNFLKPLASWTGGIIVDVLEWIAEGLNKVSDWIEKNQGVVEDMIIVIGSFAAAWGLVTLALEAWNIAVVVWNSIGLVASVVTKAFGVAVAFLTSPITLTVLAIGALIAIVILLVKHWDTVKEVAAKVWNSITGVWGKAPSWFSSKVLEPIKKGFKGVINFLVGLAEGFANGFIKGINAIIKALGGLSFKTPDWVPLIGGKNFGIKIPSVKEISIPRLATGAVIPPNAEFLAILGDQRSGRNIETPEGLLRQLFREESGTSEIVYALNEILSAVREGKVLAVDKQVLAKVVNKAQADSFRMAGGTVIPV